MAFGGGTWLAQNKALPGTYVNFVSGGKASATLSNRGIAALPLPLGWGVENQVFQVTQEDFQKNSLEIFGYSYTAPAMLPLRELFRNARTAMLYRLCGTTTQAVCSPEGVTLATAKHGGGRGNALRLVITSRVEDPDTCSLSLWLEDVMVFSQSVVKTMADALPNPYVTWNTQAELVPTAGAPFFGGGDGVITSQSHQAALDRLESYAFHTLGCVAEDEITKGLYVAYTKRMREEIGAKFQLVAHQVAGDYEGVISVENLVEEIPGVGRQGLVYYVLGLEAACPVHKSCTNHAYAGELTVLADYTQAQLEHGLQAGKLLFHNAGGTMRVLDDRNTLVSLTLEKGEDFQSNQTIRVCDQIANDAAVLFHTRYAGIIPNDKAGRADLWNDLCKLIQQLEKHRAVEDFDTKSAVVTQGESKKAVVLTLEHLNITNAMAQLYMAVHIR